MEKSENLARTKTVWEVFKYIFSHPVEIIFWRWNWKAAVLSGIMRGSIYFFTHISLGLRAALGAMSVEFLFRVLNSGASASVSQSFRKATPTWLATCCIMLLMPMYSHVIEYSIHTLNGDQNKNKSILVSITFSALSAVFNLFAMRRGTLLVNDEEQKTFWQDLKRLPVLAIQFVTYPFARVFGKVKP